MALVKVQVLQLSMGTVQPTLIHQHGLIGIQQLTIPMLEITMNTMVLFLKRFIHYHQQLIIILLDTSLQVVIGNMVVIRAVFGMELVM